jgi:lipoate-protein ligase A
MRVEHVRGSAVEFHERPMPDDGDVHLWHFDLDRPAVALGSRQDLTALDEVAVAASGYEVVRRRSGGGAVLLLPGQIVWVDLVVPVALLPTGRDLRASMVWVGELWAAALAQAGGSVVPDVHRGGMWCTAWSSLVCFAGIGPGELVLEERKLLGLSQRRSRQAARFQCAVHQAVDLAAIVPLLAGALPAPDLLPGVAVLAEVTAAPADDVVAALGDQLAAALA